MRLITAIVITISTLVVPIIMASAEGTRQWEGWEGSDFAWMWGVPELWWYGLARVFAHNSEVVFRSEDATSFWVKGKVKEGKEKGVFGVAFPWVKPLEKGFVYKFQMRMAPPEHLPDFITVNGNIVWKKEQGYAEYPRVEFEYVPEQLKEDAEVLLVKACLPSELSWRALPQPRASWDERANRGEIDNGIIKVSTDGRTATLSFGDRVLLQGLHFFGLLDEERRQKLSPEQASKLPPLNTTIFESISGSAASSSEQCALTLRKECAGGARGVFVIETLLLHSKVPIFEYRLQFQNRRSKPVFIANWDGVIHARFGEGLPVKKQLLLPTGFCYGELTREWLSIHERDLPEAQLRWMLVQGDRDAISFLNLSEHMHAWAFTEGGFWFYVAGLKAERPIKIPPGGSASFGVAFIVLSTEDVFEATLSAFKLLKDGKWHPNPKLVVRKWQTLHPPHQGYWHTENLRCLRARYDKERPAYEKFSLPKEDIQWFSIEPTIACRRLEEYNQPVEYKKPPLKKLPYVADDVVLVDYYHYLPLQTPNGVDGFFFSLEHWNRDAKFIDSLEWAKELKALGFKKIVMHPLWKEDGHYRGCHWIDAMGARKIDETKEALIKMAKGWLSIVPDGEVYLFYPEVQSCYGHWGLGILDAPIAEIPGYEKVRKGGKEAWELCFKFFRELTDELKRKIGGKVKVIAQLDRAAFQGAYLLHCGMDIIMHKNIHRQSLNIVVANSRGAARAYGKEYGFDFDAWDRQYWWSYHHKGIYQGLLVYYHAGGKYIIPEVPTAYPHGHGGGGKLNKCGEMWLDFCRYARSHPKRGEQQVKVAVMRALGDEWNRVAGPSAG